MRTIRASILQMEFGVGGHGSGSGSGNLLTTSMLQLLLLPFILLISWFLKFIRSSLVDEIIYLSRDKASLSNSRILEY